MENQFVFAVPPHRLDERERLARESPAASLVGEPRQRVHDRVEVGRDVLTPVLEVVSRVDDGRERPRRKRASQAAQQTSAADAARKGHHCSGRESHA